MKFCYHSHPTDENFFFNPRKFTKTWSCSKISIFFSSKISWISLEIVIGIGHLQKISSYLLRIFVKIWLLKKISIFYLRGGPPRRKLPKIQPSFDRALQSKWSPRTSPQSSAHILGSTMSEKIFLFNLQMVRSFLVLEKILDLLKWATLTEWQFSNGLF